MAQRNLFQGCTGSDVRTLQKNLKSLGYYQDGAVDGSFGPITDKAVRQFQKKAKILVDGVVGPQTRAALSKALKAKKKKTTTKTTKTTTKATVKKTVVVPKKKAAVDTTSPRQATASITYDPTGRGSKNTRNSSEMAKYMEEFTYTDPATGESDSASLELCNISMIWANKWLPKKGDKFTATIDTLNWSKAGTSNKFSCGTFCCDDRNFSFPGNATATIQGTSVPEKQAFRSTLRSKTWKNITIKEIARRIAKRYKLKLYYDAATIKVKSKEQSKKDDCSFLKDLTNEYGLYIKVYGGKIIIYDAARYEAKKSVATIDYNDVINGEYNSTLAGTYTGATIKYTKGSNKKEYTYKVGSGSRILTLTEKVDNLTDARIKAKAQLAEENRKAETIKLTIAAEGLKLRASSCFTLKNAYEMNGKYFIDKITRKVGASGGYTVEIDAHKVQSSGSSKKVTFKKGNRVNVNGKAYYTSSGGKAKTCKNLTAYIVSVANGSKKYPYAISKRKGGKRYGWVAKSSLKKA